VSFDLSNYYDSSFAGVSFWEQYESGYSANEPPVEEEIALMHIPGGNSSVLQSFGRLARRFDLPIAIQVADLATLLTKVGVSGTLVCHLGSISARLTKVDNIRAANRGLNARKATLSFTLL